MTDIVVEVGPATVRGPDDAQVEWASVALECIDDHVALIEDQPVSVAEVWREVLRSAMGTSRTCDETAVLVFPTWWPQPRIELVCGAARAGTANVVALQRADALRGGLPNDGWAVAEIAPEFVVITSPEDEVMVVSRLDDPEVARDAVARNVAATAGLLLDAPAGVQGASALGAAIADRARATGIAVSIADRDWVRRTVAAMRTNPSTTQQDPGDDEVSSRRSRRWAPVVVGTVISAALLSGGFAVRSDRPGPAGENVPTTLLVEGRVGVKVPALWPVERIVSGPGSARVQVVSPSDTDLAVHVTQSLLPIPQSQAAAAEELRAALDKQPAGVFVDFNPADSRAGRSAVTYREVRADIHIAWSVFVDDVVRIAIGCQSSPGREDRVRDACNQAIQSAHAVF